MKRKKIVPISKDELEKLSTERLLARLKSLHQCEQSFELSDKSEDERNLKPEFIDFKDSIEWQEEYIKLKRVLDKREHIPKK